MQEIPLGNFPRYGSGRSKSHATCMTFTRDLETEGHVMVYVTFFISACINPTAMIFMLFREVFRYRNSFQLSPFAWPSRVTLKLKVTSRSTWLLLFMLVCVLPRWLFFYFVRFLVQGIHSNYCQLRDLHAWPWKPKANSLYYYYYYYYYHTLNSSLRAQ